MPLLSQKQNNNRKIIEEVAVLDEVNLIKSKNKRKPSRESDLLSGRKFNAGPKIKLSKR